MTIHRRSEVSFPEHIRVVNDANPVDLPGGKGENGFNHRNQKKHKPGKNPGQVRKCNIFTHTSHRNEAYGEFLHHAYSDVLRFTSDRWLLKEFPLVVSVTLNRKLHTPWTSKAFL